MSHPKVQVLLHKNKLLQRKTNEFMLFKVTIVVQFQEYHGTVIYFCTNIRQSECWKRRKSYYTLETDMLTPVSSDFSAALYTDLYFFEM